MAILQKSYIKEFLIVVLIITTNINYLITIFNIKIYMCRKRIFKKRMKKKNTAKIFLLEILFAYTFTNSNLRYSH